MKKILTALLAIVLTSSIAATAAESRIQNWVDNLISPVTTKEKELNDQAEAQQRAYEKQQKAQQRAYKKKQKEREKSVKEAQRRRENTKNAIESETSFWKSLFSRNN